MLLQSFFYVIEGVNPLQTNKPLVLIPIKDFSETKSRLKAALPQQKAYIVDKIVRASFLFLIELLNNIEHPFGVISPSRNIIAKSKELGAIFTFQDSGEGLNEALTKASKKLTQQSPLLIIMPDLPFITQKFLQSLIDSIQNEDMLIIPSISDEENMGTALLYLKRPFLVSFSFGVNSCLKYQNEAKKRGLKYRIISYDPFARDLDTLKDIEFLKSHLEMVYEPNRFIKLLAQIS